MKYRVNINAANEAKSGFSRIIDGKDYRLLNRVGAFASLFRINLARYKEPVLVLKTEEPGTKQILAFQHDRIESVCYDMINHLINDCVVMGAEPLAVQDLIVCGKIDKTTVTRIVSAVTDACAKQECVLTGGETTEQPDVLPSETYILGSSIVGVADFRHLIDGTKIKDGDTVIAIASSGPHTNGYTLIRDLLDKFPKLCEEPIGPTTFLEAVLTPHRCYYQSIKSLFDGRAVGLAHITGGGIKENLNRILPSNVDAVVDLGLYKTPPVFQMIQKAGSVSKNEMLRTFNLGVGLVVVCHNKDTASVIAALEEAGEEAYTIGSIVSGTGQVQCVGDIKYDA